MNRFCPALAVLLAACLPLLQGQPDPGMGKKYALLVGVRDYDHAALKALKFTENDVEELAKVLKDKGDFETVRVLSTTRGKGRAEDAPTGANVRSALRGILARKTRHDTVLLALAGHGVQRKIKGEGGKKRDEGFFCPSDAQLNEPDTMLGLTALFDDLRECGAGVKLLLMDACRNEVSDREARNVDVATLPRPPRGTAALFSCASGERAFETAKLGKGHGVFFHYVLQGLKGEAKNRKGEVTWDHLATYVKSEVPGAVARVIGDGARQSPHLVTDLIGEPPVLVAKGAGWRTLFNGTDLTGWKVHPEGTGKWKVEDGAIVGSGRRSHLFSERGNYENFHFRVEAKINDKGNSGQFFRAKFGGASYPGGYEAQINVASRDPVRTGSLFALVEREGSSDVREDLRVVIGDRLHEPDEWFTQEVIAVGNRITIKVNGKTTVDFEDEKKRHSRGHFALQHHDSETVVRFRKVEVKELPPSAD